MKLWLIVMFSDSADGNMHLTLESAEILRTCYNNDYVGLEQDEPSQAERTPILLCDGKKK